MNHKRKHAKQSRAGCLLCKPNNLGKGMEKKLGHRGFGNTAESSGSRAWIERCHARREYFMRKFRMPMISNTLRKRLRELADQLPADAAWDDAREKARFRKAVEAGLAAADRGALDRG